MRYLLAIALLSACTNDDNASKDPPTEVGKIIVADCGQAPLAPGWAVAYDNGTAKLSASEFQAIEAWRAEYDVWRDCVVTHP